MIRVGGEVAFVVSGAALGPWTRGSKTALVGPLSSALAIATSQTQTDRYRAGLAYERELFCATEKVHSGLAIAVMRTTPFVSGLSTLPEVEPSYQRNESWCQRCNEERTKGWCDDCSGRRCPACDSCDCTVVVSATRFCPGCTLTKAESVFSSTSAELCRDCD